MPGHSLRSPGVVHSSPPSGMSRSGSSGSPLLSSPDVVDVASVAVSSVPIDAALVPDESTPLGSVAPESAPLVPAESAPSASSPASDELGAASPVDPALADPADRLVTLPGKGSFVPTE